MSNSTFHVEIDTGAAHELVLSLSVFNARRLHKTLELGSQWVTKVRKMLPSTFGATLETLERSTANVIPLLLWQSPMKGNAREFIGWLGQLSVGDIYERVAPYLSADAPPLPRDLGSERDTAVEVLSLWEEHYFRTVDPGILRALEADAVAKRAIAGSIPPVDLVELATGGLRFSDDPTPARILLVPQYHGRPINIYTPYHDLMVIAYPCDAAVPGVNGESSGLLRTTRALGDENRLRILRYLADRVHTFTEIVQISGLAKSTVHHHMVTLRAAGLVRVHNPASGAEQYSLRPGVADSLAASLAAFLKGE